MRNLLPAQQLLLIFKIRTHHSLNLSLTPGLPLSDSRTKTLNFGFPGLGIHNLRPKRPRSALIRAGFVNRAAFVFEEDAVGLVFDFFEVPDFGRLVAVFLLEGAYREVEVFGKAGAVFFGKENEAEFAVRRATFARSLAFEFEALLIK